MHDSLIARKLKPIAPTKTEELTELFVHYLTNKIILDLSDEQVKNFTDYTSNDPYELFNKLLAYIPNTKSYLTVSLEEFTRKVKPNE